MQDIIIIVILDSRSEINKEAEWVEKVGVKSNCGAILYDLKYFLLELKALFSMACILESGPNLVQE